MLVEKVFFQKPEGDEDEDGNKAIDLGKENPYTFFMVSFLCDIPNIIIKCQHFQGPQAHNRDCIYHAICQA
jgi:hypothetical protein